MTSGDHSATSNATFEWLLTARAAMATVTASLADAPFSPAVEAIDQFRNELTAVESLLIAKREEAGHSKRSTEGIIKKSGGVSKSEAKKRTSRGSAIKKNPKLAKKLTDGDLSTEQIDVLADAADKTDGAAARDDKLIDELSGANPDIGRGIARRFVEDHNTPNDRNTRYEKQRAWRKVSKGRSESGNAQVIIEGDDETVDGMFRSLRRRADAMYRKDGGRDVPHSKHPRTHNQRMFDAAAEKLAAEDIPSTRPSSDSGPASDSDAPRRMHSTQPQRRSGERPTMVFTTKLTDITDDPELLAQWEAELISTGIVPTAVASYYRCISEFAGIILNGKGDPLWKGRSTRRATPEQWVALVVRDLGCIRCGADAHVCQAHHLVPFSAPAKGETNIDEMVLLCTDCHTWVHETDQTIVWDPGTGTWQYRNARWEERAAKRPGWSKPGAGRSERPPPKRQSSTAERYRTQRLL